jgi:transcriptional repressor NrdR
MACGERFTTFERVEQRQLWVAKRDGTREPFDRDKIVRGVALALRKRPFTPEQLEEIVGRIVRRLDERREPTIPSSAVGEAVMDVLRETDEVAYVRFASVYRAFESVDQFLHTVDPLRITRGDAT